MRDERILIISACPADVNHCLGVTNPDSSNKNIYLIITWVKSETKIASELISLFRTDNSLIKIDFVTPDKAIEISRYNFWRKIFIFTMGAAWLGVILHEKQSIIRYMDCYMDYTELDVRNIKWKHCTILKFHGLKYWLKTQLLRFKVWLKYSKFNLKFYPDMHVWPEPEFLRKAWDHDLHPKLPSLAKMLPENSMILCFSSIDNGWSPNWEALKKLKSNVYCKPHPRTGEVEYDSYPDWVIKLEGYDLPIELYRCPLNTLLVGTTSTALGMSDNSISLWNIKLKDYNKHNSLFFRRNQSHLNYLNCRKDLLPYYEVYSSKAGLLPMSYKEIKPY